jgi:hypothetical protein
MASQQQGWLAARHWFPWLLVRAAMQYYSNVSHELCPSEPVAQLAEAYRRRQQHDFLNLVPCDLFKLIQGRTLWMVGDRWAAVCVLWVHLAK